MPRRFSPVPPRKRRVLLSGGTAGRGGKFMRRLRWTELSHWQGSEPLSSSRPGWLASWAPPLLRAPRAPGTVRPRFSPRTPKPGSPAPQPASSPQVASQHTSHPHPPFASPPPAEAAHTSPCPLPPSFSYFCSIALLSGIRPSPAAPKAVCCRSSLPEAPNL